jgi:endonuclease YncB( thermonuclease family)
MGNCINTTTDKSIQPSLGVPISVSIQDEKKEIVHTIEEINPYNEYTYENTPEFTFNGLRKKIKVLRVIDGDTVDIALQHDDTHKVYRHRVRLYGIDTPEKRPPKDDPYREKEIAASILAVAALDTILKDNDYIVLALFYKPDKYGRLMCSFYDKYGDDINKRMITNGHAYEYLGKTKKKFQP